jgi:phosphonopyruvate decarboxylase
MLSPSVFYNFLKKKGVSFYVGVPDSLLKNFCYFVSKKISLKKHIIAANEGSAIAIASGYNIATSKIPLVYLQNSGLGNTINPILSLADKKVFSTPMIIMIGWRGEPGTKDEPQHKVQGDITLSLIKCLKKKYKILNGNQNSDLYKTQQVIKIAKKYKEPVFLIVKKNTFKRILKIKNKKSKLLSRESTIGLITDASKKNFKIISTTGMISRELYEIRKKKNEKGHNDLLVVGSMGHASQIALSIALNTKKKIICLDGDGAFLMHMGGISTIGSFKLNNFIHIVLNNISHDSVGGQPTSAQSTSLAKVAEACGYKNVIGPLKSKKNILKNLKLILNKKSGPSFIEILVKKGSRKDLGRPDEKPIQNKYLFFKNIKK